MHTAGYAQHRIWLSKRSRGAALRALLLRRHAGAPQTEGSYVLPLALQGSKREFGSVALKSAKPAIALGAVILGAGRSSRMGQPKLLLPWGETTVLGHLARQWSELGARQVAVVTAAADAALETELQRLNFPSENRIRNHAPERGMFSSIQCAAQWPGWSSTLTHWAILLGDQPHLRVGTLQSVITFAAMHPDQAVQPARNGRPRHPVLLPKALFRELAASTAPDLKEFLSRHESALCECGDPGLDLDIDRPEDYDRALSLAFSAAHVLPQSIR